MCRSEAESGVMCDGSPRKTLRTADVTEEETEDRKGPAPGNSRSKNQPSPASTPAGCQQDSQAHTLPGAGVSLNTQGQACAHGGGGGAHVQSGLGSTGSARNPGCHCHLGCPTRRTCDSPSHSRWPQRVTSPSEPAGPESQARADS